MQDISVKDIAERIQRPGETLQTAIDRVRNWTKEGLLSLAGEKNPGTGRARRYSRDALLEASLLNILNDIGIPAARAAPWMRALKKEVDKHWKKAGPFQPGPPIRKFHTLEGLPGRNSPDRPLLLLSKSVGKDQLVVTGLKLSDLQKALLQERYDLHTIIDIHLMFDRLLTPLEEI